MNEAAGIALAIERAWATGPHEVIVVDGGSRDATLEVARRSRCLVFVASRGRGRQLNLGASHASGEVLLFLHADTWLAPDGLRQMEHALDEHQAAWGAFRQHIEADGRLYRLLERANARRILRRGMAYGDQGIFVRRRVFEQVGGFPDVPILEDLLLCKALRRISAPVLLAGPLHVSARRWQKHGVIRQTLRNRLILAAHALGVKPARLARWYAPHEES